MEKFTDEWLETTLRRALAEEPRPSQDAVGFALGLARMLPKPSRPSLLARLVSSGQPLATARGGEAQQRLYETDSHLITLWDEADAGSSRYLIGQVYDKTSGPLIPTAVTLLSAQSTEQDARQEGSEFHVAAVAPGTYALRCALLDTDILVPEIEVGE